MERTMNDNETPRVQASQPRETARITLTTDNSIWSAPTGTVLEEYFKQARPDLVPMLRSTVVPESETIVAAIVDNHLRELTTPIKRDAEIQPVLLQDGDGLRIYRRSLSFVLTVAAAELFPGRKIRIDHSLPFGGYYCAVDEGGPLSKAELARLKARMDEIIAADEPIWRKVIPLSEAYKRFEDQGDNDKIRLLSNRDKDYLTVYELRGVTDYFYGYMVPSTGYLFVYDLTYDGDGFILHYPRRRAPNEIQPVTTLPKLRAVFHEAAEWLKLLDLEDMGALNDAIRAGHAREIILVAEALHEGRFADIADAVLARRPDVSLVLIAGPSSSGKTTSSKRLAVQLMAHGLKPFTLAMDNYFVPRDRNPVDPVTGDLDFEHIEAVDLDLFNQHVLALMDGQEVEIPHYNFKTGDREPGENIHLTPEHILIVEGIHGLNPELVRQIPPERIFRLYVSCLTQLNIDRHNRVPTTDVRLLRRIVRDARTRGYAALDTLSRWNSVRNGERRWIFPYQENANLMFNSALVYELAALRPLAEPLLLQVKHDSVFHAEAKRLLSFLGWVEPLPNTDVIPDNSVLREFVGGSILDSYLPGQPSLNGADHV
jgi:uridine kinase